MTWFGLGALLDLHSSLTIKRLMRNNYIFFWADEWFIFGFSHVMSFKASRIEKKQERKLHRFLFRLAGKIWRRSSSTNLKNSGAMPMPPQHRRHRQSTHHSCQTRGNDWRGESHQRKKEIRLRERDTRASVFFLGNSNCALFQVGLALQS